MASIEEIEKAGKRKGVFLVIVDESEEFLTAVEYATQFANAEHGYVALLNIIEDMHVQNWQNIEDKIRAELRSHAEQMIWDAAGKVIENTGKIPMVCVEEGDKSEIILQTIENNKNIVTLVLASSYGSSNPGPLVTYFSGKGLSRLSVPLMIVPGGLENL